MRSNLFWLSDEQWQRIEPHLLKDMRGKDRGDDRRVISGILHILKSGCRWCDCPPDYEPPTTIYKPVHGILRPGPKRALNNGGDLVIVDRSLPAGAPFLQKALDAVLQKAPPPICQQCVRGRRVHAQGFCSARHLRITG